MKNEDKKKEPEKILNAIKKEEFRKHRGKLKIFFGMAAGVGKTYEMLQYTHRLKKEGVDIVIGYIETHNRIDTAKLTEGLEAIPRKKINYKNSTMEEMDIDEIIKRKPEAVLIDELAHTNTPGSRHAKRYLDVLEIMDYGIDVYTTLNIQHLESYSVTVEEITGVPVKETLPDGMLEYADSIELIDLTPEELLKRFEEGKVYTKEKSQQAVENFFKKENLTALREMSLRYTAKKVDRQLDEFIINNNKTWKTHEKLLVAVSPSPNSQYIIKWAKRASYNLKSDWMVLYVENNTVLSETSEASLRKNLDLARSLGAEIITTYDDNIVNGILRTAHQKNATQIIIGKTLHKSFYEKIFGRKIIDRLINESGNIDINVIAESKRKIEYKKNLNLKLNTPLKDYLLSALIITIITFFNIFLSHFTGYWTIGIIYLSVVTICAIFLGRGSVVFAATLSAVLWNYIFIPPKKTFYIGKLEDLLMFIMYFIIALITGNLTSRLKTKENALRIREKRISNLYEISNMLSKSNDIDEIIKNSVELIQKFLNAQTIFYIMNSASGNLNDKAHKDSNFFIEEKEHNVILWSFENNKTSGRFTNTLPLSQGYYIPLIGSGGTYGVIGFNLIDLKVLNLDHENFIKAAVKLIALSIERFFLIEKMQKIKIDTESEKLYKIILNSISHELRTPLTSIINSASGLMDKKMFNNAEIRKTLLFDIKESTDRMNSVVGNLLDMTRLESGKFKLHKEWNDINDILNASLNKLQEKMSNIIFIKEISNELPLLYADFKLIEQVLTNLLLNAIQHNNSGVKIILKIYKKEDSIYFSVQDDGIGIPADDMDKIFDKFYKVSKSKTGGTGLGLSVCKSIIELHEGKIYAYNNEDKGVTFVFYLPYKEYQ